MKNPDDKIEFEGVTFTRAQLEEALRKMDDRYRFRLCGKIVTDITIRDNRFIVLDEATQRARGATSKGLVCVYLAGSRGVYQPGTTYFLRSDNLRETGWPTSYGQTT